MDTTELVMRFTALDFVSQIAGNIGNAIQGLTTRMSSSGEEQASTWQKVGAASMVAGGIMIAAAGGLALIGGTAVDAASKFQRSMELIHTQAGASQAQVEQLSQAVLQLAPAVGMGPDELAAGLFHIVSVGVPAAQQMDVLKIAALGAKTGMADMETVTNALAATMVSGIGGVKGAADAMGQLNAIVGAGNMRMQDLVGALSTGILPAAATFGLKLQDVGAALATLTDLGTPAEEAATRLRMTFSMMAAPTLAAAKELKSIGMTSLEMGDIMRNQGLVPALRDLRTHLEGAGLTATQQGEVLARAFGGGRSSAAIMGLLQNLDRVQQKHEQIGATSGDFGESVAATTDTLGYKTAQLNAAWQTLQITLGQALIPVITQLVTTVTPFITKLADWISHNQKLVGTIAPLVVAGMALLGVLLLVVGIIAILASPITLIVLGIMLLVAVIALAITHWSQIHAVITAVWNTIKGFAASLVGDVVGAWNAVTGAIGRFIGGVAGAIGGFFSRLGSLASAAWQEFSRHPLYWIGYLVAFIPIKLLELELAFAKWVANLIVAALRWSEDMVKAAIQMAVNFNLAVGRELIALPGQVWGWLSSVVPMVVRWGLDLISTGVRIFVDFNVAAAQELNKLPGQMWNIGVAIVQGIINGIKSMIGAGVGAIGDFVQGLVQGAKDAAKSSSPSLLFAEQVGLPIAQGIALGIQRGALATKASLAGVVADMAGTLGSVASVPAMIPSVAAPGGVDLGDTNDLLLEQNSLLEDIRAALRPVPSSSASSATFSTRAYGRA